jgi:hypothetical protein
MIDFVRDRLGKAKWQNNPFMNSTQSRYSRFVRRPTSRLRSIYDDSVDEWNKKKVGILGDMFTDPNMEA